MTVDVLNALSLIWEAEPKELLVTAILAIIFALRDWCECDPQRTIKTRNGGDHGVSRRVDDGHRVLHINGINPCAVGCDGRKNRTPEKREGMDHRVCARVDDLGAGEWARHVKARTIRRNDRLIIPLTKKCQSGLSLRLATRFAEYEVLQRSTASLGCVDFVSHIFDVSLGLVFRVDLLVVLNNPGLLCFVLSIQLTAFQFRFQKDVEEADDVSGIGKRLVMDC